MLGHNQNAGAPGPAGQANTMSTYQSANGLNVANAKELGKA